MFAVERFYRALREQLGVESLDQAIGRLDFGTIEAGLQGFLTTLRNESIQKGFNRDQVWQSALRFVTEILSHLGHAEETKAQYVRSRLSRIERLYRQISPRPLKEPNPIRALPAAVVEDLYDIFNPNSGRNPFSTARLRWRNFLIFLMLLYMGLRRGELLALPVDAIKDDFDPSSGDVRYWLNVDTSKYEDDPRSDEPALKNLQSRRQLPVSREIVSLTDAYVQNYRGRPAHTFLFNSQRDKPLAQQSVADVLATASQALSPAARKTLSNIRKAAVTLHDLRHTAAVYRLARFKKKYDDLDEAIDRLRVYFGWSITSLMPRHYARAYFETALSEVWNERFDDFVDTLRSATGEKH